MDTFFWSSLVWITPVVLLVISYITGDLLHMLFHARNGIAAKVISGFCVLLCLFHLISLPFMYNEWPFTSLYWLFLSAVIAIFVAYCLLSFLNKRLPLKEDLEDLFRSVKRIAQENVWLFVIWAVVLCLILWQIAMVILHVSYNVDDNFYIGESVTILNRNVLMNTLPASGMEGSVFPATYLLVSWEVFLAALSKLFLAEPAILCHSILPAFLIPMHYLVLYLVGKEIRKEHTSIFLLFAVFMNMVCGPSTYDSGAFLILRIWQGKAVLVNLFLPLLLYVFLRILKAKKVSLRNIFYLFAVLLASQAASTVGTYLAPVLYAVYAIAFLILIRRWKEFFKLLIPAAGILPFVLFKIWLLFSAGSLQSLSEGTGVHARSFYELATRYFGWNLAPLLLILAIVILAIRLKGQKKDPLQFFFLIATAALLVLFINPIVMPFVESYITGAGVYWRIFWLLQANIVIASGLTKLCMLPTRKLLQSALVVFMSCVLLISGHSIFKDEDVKEVFDNTYKVSSDTVLMADSIEKDIAEKDPELTDAELRMLMQESVILMPRDISREMRQYKDIALIYYVYLSNNYMEYQTKYEYTRLKALYKSLYTTKSFQPDTVMKEVRFLGIDYVAIPSDTVKAKADSIPDEFVCLCDGSDFTLYKTNID
ncbi:MAG: hypothetical protein IKZ95_06150 [Lachnospiraceae bacterium]|nr:hypothetical protein [Lachnospiraceae bacterium]